MATQNQNEIVTLTVGASALSKWTRVKLAAGLLVVAGAGEQGIGVVQDNYAVGDLAAVRLNGSDGTFKVVASAAITANALVYGAASGKVSSTAVGPVIGVALEAASADGNEIEVLPIVGFGPGPQTWQGTISAGDVTATYVEVDTGFGATPSFMVGFTTTSAGVMRVTTVAASGSTGTVRLTPTGITAGDKYYLIASR